MCSPKDVIERLTKLNKLPETWPALLWALINQYGLGTVFIGFSCYIYLDLQQTNRDNLQVTKGTVIVLEKLANKIENTNSLLRHMTD